MKIVAVIPARYASSRFPGKPLALIAGKPMLQWVVEAARSTQTISKVIVATDNGEIFNWAENFGVSVAMTPVELPSGSDRVNAAVLNEEADVIVNIQGDEPLLTGDLLDRLVEPFNIRPDIEMTTLSTELMPGELEDKNVVKGISDKLGNAIYFSRFAIPYSRLDAAGRNPACWKHVGLYAYRKPFLEQFCKTAPVEMELAESLEQLRALHLGAKIHVVPVNCRLHGVDTPEDIEKVEALIREKG